LHQADYNGLVRLKFKFPPLADENTPRTSFSKRRNTIKRCSRKEFPAGHGFGMTGSGESRVGISPNARLQVQSNRRGMSHVEDTFDLFSAAGLAENLQLDRAMPAQRAVRHGRSLVDRRDHDRRDGLEEAGERRIEAGPRSAGRRDSSRSTCDLLPDFAKLLEVADHLDEQGSKSCSSPVFVRKMHKPRSATSAVVPVDVSVVAAVGPALVKSVAITGSDPYFISEPTWPCCSRPRIRRHCRR